MEIRNVAAVAAVGALLSGCAQNYVASPIAEGEQQIRYMQGIPTTTSDKPDGSVQVTSLGYISDDSRLVFGAAAFNKGHQPANFGLENITVTTNGKPLPTYSREQLAHEAKVKATWAAVATVLAGAAAAYSANQAAHSTTTGTIYGPRGVSTFQINSYNPGVAAAGAAVAGAATGYQLNSIKNSLDNTISHLNGAILQENTIDPGAAAGGELVMDLPRAKTYPQRVEITVNWNGATHVFEFDVSKAKG